MHRKENYDVVSQNDNYNLCTAGGNLQRLHGSYGDEKQFKSGIAVSNRSCTLALDNRIFGTKVEPQVLKCCYSKCHTPQNNQTT